MALIKCPECKKKVSDQCGNCLNCGYPIKGNIIKNKERNLELGIENNIIEDGKKQNGKSINRKKIVVIAIVIAVVLILGGIIGCNVLKPKINAIKEFNMAVATVKEKNKQLEVVIDKSEKLLLEKQPLLDETLIQTLEMAISDTKAVKETNFKTPRRVKDWRQKLSLHLHICQNLMRIVLNKIKQRIQLQILQLLQIIQKRIIRRMLLRLQCSRLIKIKKL